MEDREHSTPPVFRSWKGWYWLVFLVVVVQLAVYLIITFSFR